MYRPNLEKILVSIQLTTEKDYNKVLSMIVEKGMQITKCDASTLYLYEDDILKFRIMRTISQGVTRGLDGSLGSLAAIEMANSYNSHASQADVQIVTFRRLI